MTKLPFLPIFTDDFLQDTAHMDGLESGVYAILLMVAWRNKARLPDDDISLARWARVDPRTWRRLKPKIMPFWTLVDGFWTQARLSKEYENACKRADVARQNGSQGGRPKSLENKETNNPTGYSRDSNSKALYIEQDIEEDCSFHSQSSAIASEPDFLVTEPEKVAPAPNDKSRKPKKVPSGEHPAFSEFWEVYPRHIDRKAASKAFSAAIARGADPPTLVYAARQYAAQMAGSDPKYIKHATTWLNGECWKNERESSAGRQRGNGFVGSENGADGEPFSHNIRAIALAERRAERLARGWEAAEPESRDPFGDDGPDRSGNRVFDAKSGGGSDNRGGRTGLVLDAESWWPQAVKS